MTIRELITRLANYPPDAEVLLYTGPTGYIELDENSVQHYNPDGDTNYPDEPLAGVIEVKGTTTDDNAYRRGALDQLFDEVSTGVTKWGVEHESISEAAGRDVLDGFESLIDEFEAE